MAYCIAFLLIGALIFAHVYAQDCFMDDMKSKGNPIVNDQPRYLNVANATMCQEKYCQEYAECEYFVYNKKTKSCNLKRAPAFDAKSPSEGHIFGPQYCPNVHYGILSNKYCTPSGDKRYETLFEAKKACKDLNCASFYHEATHKGFYLCLDHATIKNSNRGSVLYTKEQCPDQPLGNVASKEDMEKNDGHLEILNRNQTILTPNVAMILGTHINQGMMAVYRRFFRDLARQHYPLEIFMTVVLVQSVPLICILIIEK